MITERRRRETGQLLYKAWLETRGRFIGAAVVVALLGLATVVRASATIAGWERFHAGEAMPYALYVWLSLSHGYLQFIWIICAILLGLGGLVREQARGTAGFTLALPVSRRALVWSRAAVGAAEAAALALLPEAIVALLSPLAGYDYPFAQALLFALLIAGGGMVFYALGFLLSHLIGGEYAAPGIGLGLAAGYYVVAKLPGMESFNVYGLMTGARYMIGKTYSLGAGYPVWPLLAWAALAAGLIAVAARLAARRDF
jgi:hypothetical protein